MKVSFDFKGILCIPQICAWKRVPRVGLRLCALALLVVLQGCGHSGATIARMDGFNAQWRGFEALKGTKSFHRETEIKVKVIVVGDSSEIGYPGAVATYSHPQGVIHIVGKMVNGKILLCPAVLGHEIQHALEYQDQDGAFANPDKLEEFGY